MEGCIPNCAGKQCGADGCGGACGACGFDWHCNMTTFQCEEDDTCVPDCHGKQCGGDDCGGVCGNCPPGYECGDSFKCNPDEPEGEDVTPDPGVTDCPAGYSLLYGNCVQDDDLDGGTSGGCSTGAGAAPATPAAWLLVLGLLAMAGALRRRHSQV